MKTHRFTPRPSEPEFLKLSKTYGRVPVSAVFHADLETPLSAYLKLGGGPGSFLLESVEKDEKVARYSIVGYEPVRTFTALGGHLTERAGRKTLVQRTDNPLATLKDRYTKVKQAPLPPGSGFAGGLVGYLAYDIARRFERLPEKAVDELKIPELCLMETGPLAVFDHLERTLRLVANVDLTSGTDPRKAYRNAVRDLEKAAARLSKPLTGTSELPDLPMDPGKDPLYGFRSNLAKDRYLAGVEKTKEYIRSGDVIQVVLSQRFSKDSTADPLTVYRVLRRLNPSPYMFLLRLEGLDVVGASPEMLLKVQDGRVETRPIAGTRPRGKSPAEDQALAEGLLEDPKELAEHVMLVDLGRNDLGRVCTYGTVRVDRFKHIERYSHVMHIVSDVSGTLAPDRTSFDAFQACFPAGTLSGAPKIRAMEIIEELEPSRRGVYGGSVATFGFDGNLDSAIAIRSLVMRPKGKGKYRVHVQAGGGIVADSVPETEYQETCNKARAVLLAVAKAEQLGPPGSSGRKPGRVSKGGPR